MSVSLGTVRVLNHETSEKRDLELVDGPEGAHFDAVEQVWSPRLDAAHDRASVAFNLLPAPDQTEDRWQDFQTKYGGPDSHWNWRDKQKGLRPASQRLLALLDAGSVEALMLIDLSRHSRLVARPVTQIVYVEYLAIAPWSRPQIQSVPRFRGLGKLMLGVAVAISRQEHMDGRCGLHSLIQSEGFYRKLKMTDLGLDPASGNLRYFEFDPNGANNFLGGP